MKWDSLHIVLCEACTTIPSCHLQQALHQLWLWFLCIRVLYFLPFYETFNAVQAEIRGKIPDPILEISSLQLQGLLSMLAEHFELQKSSGRWWQGLRSLTICKTYDGVALIFARHSVFHLIPIWLPLQGFRGKGWEALISSSSVQYRTVQGIILLSESPDVTFPR